MEIQSARSLNIFPSRPEPEPSKAEAQSSSRGPHVRREKAEAQESGQAPRGQDQEALFFRGSAGANCQLSGGVLRARRQFFSKKKGARRQIIKPDSVAIKKRFRSGFMEGRSPVMLI